MESKEVSSQEAAAVIHVSNVVAFVDTLAVKVEWSQMGLRHLESSAHRVFFFFLDKF